MKTIVERISMVFNVFWTIMMAIPKRLLAPVRYYKRVFGHSHEDSVSFTLILIAENTSKVVNSGRDSSSWTIKLW